MESAIAAAASLVMTVAAFGQTSWEAVSPNDRITIRLSLATVGRSADYPSGQKRLYYEVRCQGRSVIPLSPLGLVCIGDLGSGARDQGLGGGTLPPDPRSPTPDSTLDFVDELTFVAATSAETLDETYTMIHGRSRNCENRYREKVVTFKNADGIAIQVVMRACDEGVAFRYQLPGDRGKASGLRLQTGGAGVQGAGIRAQAADPRTLIPEFTVLSEATGFRLPEGSKVWAHPYDVPGKYTPAYEAYWSNGVNVGTPSPSKNGWAFPLLFRTGDSEIWALITEAGLDGSYCGSHLTLKGSAPRPLTADTRSPVYGVQFPDPNEGNGVGAAQPSSTLPWVMPWRVVMVGQDPGAIVESTMVTDLSAPCALKDTNWIKPGRASWSWLSDHDSPQDCTKLKAFVDLAAQMEWEYSLVDANWNIMKNGTIHDLIAYANGKGVGLLLWYNSGGSHNSVTEQPRGTMDIRDVRRFEFERLQKWGIKGVKIDFFQSDKQDLIQLYLDILKDAADFQLMVYFHGCTLPRGWERTYPNLMTMEAVRGAECYSFDKEYPQKAPMHNVIQAFTRNVVGPMDYTPVMFADNTYPHITSYGHELALPIIFESGLLHFADAPKPYLSLPDGPKNFLKRVPAAWDETQFVAGEPGRFVILARRKGSDWYLAGINGRQIAEQVNVPLAFLASANSAEAGQGRYAMTLIADGKEPRTFDTRSQNVASRDSISVNLGPYGGFAAVIRPQ
jgi:alpha-glucosidase